MIVLIKLEYSLVGMLSHSSFDEAFRLPSHRTSLFGDCRLFDGLHLSHLNSDLSS